MNTPKEALEAKQRLVNAGRNMQLLMQDETFASLLEGLEKRISGLKDEALAATSYEDLVHKRGVIEGVSLLKSEIDTIVKRGKSAENTLKK